MSIVAIIPAHNEESSVADTIRSLQMQSLPPGRIVVAADNCSDDTERVAREAGAEVFSTVNNTHKKAGALNQALERYQDFDYVLAMDADTVLVQTFIERAIVELEDPKVGGVGAVFTAPKPKSYLELCQHMEWARYAEEIDRTGKTFVMSGTAALVRNSAFESVRQQFGRYYETKSICEDSRLTIDLKLCGWTLRSPTECTVVTETQSTVSDLFVQRRRWYLGALQNVRDAGFGRITLPYWRQQLMLAVSVTLMSLYLTLTGIAVALGAFSIQYIWLSVMLIFVVERVVTVWDESWRKKLFAAVILPELAYALILQAAYLAAMAQFITGKQGTWRKESCTDRTQVKQLGLQQPA